MVFCEQRKSHVLLIFIHMLLWWTTCNHVIAASNSLKLGMSLNATTGDELCSVKVWTANRNEPVDPDSAVLLLDDNGGLKIESKDREPIILHPSSQTTINTVATLLDTGNFVLEQIHPNGTKSKLWESFDYPTDTLLPGMKLGVNHKNGHNWSLVSWLSKLVPAPGPFSLEWEPNRKELVIKRRGQVSWTSEELRNNGFMYNTQYTIVSNENESYFTLTTSKEEIRIWTLLSTGQLINKERNDVARADKCYGYNTDGGWQKWEERPICRNKGDAFQDMQGYVNYKLGIDETNSSYGISDCQAICWSNCSCAGFTSLHDNETGCTFFTWDVMHGTNIASEGEKFYMLVKSNHHKRIKIWIWLTVTIATAILIFCLYIMYRVLRKQKYVLEEKKIMRIERQDLPVFGGPSSSHNPEVDLKVENDLKAFSYASIMEATEDFSSKNKLGQGGFGIVYKGILSTGQEVAVKTLSRTSAEGVTEFKNELTLISKLQHTNLVRLLGYCIHEEERILIYEYMPNKSLDFFLFDSTRSMLLDWNKRFNIVEGIAQGLLYLHKYSRFKIIHRDLKASNILLDENMNPKISDFGIARMFTKQDSEANTNRPVGTYGYMSPEYAMEGVFSTKSDVYSFGVLLLEIVSGKRNNSIWTEERTLNLIGHAWELWKEGAVLQLVDPKLDDLFSKEEVLRCVRVGLLCAEESADDRPTMSNVISMLTNKSKVTLSPKKPAYYFRTKAFEEDPSTVEFDVDSIYENGLSSFYSV